MAKLSAQQQLSNIFDALAESVVDMSDEEILAEAKEQGIDVEAESGRIKKMLLDTVSKFKNGEYGHDS